ncbi:MAG TPA: enoyl-CoA hydratase/isomerase family protein [Myxococcota bacterium]|nr:enoyl-CoA hydratase/isomerase family protein [Myxococcota bacterium]
MTVRREDRDGVRVLALARPPVNAIDFALVRALGDAVEAAASDAACRALVVTGASGVFSAGIDTKRIPSYDADERASMLRAVNRTVLALYAFEKPAVAAISGHALGAGLVLALTCDLRLAANGEFRLGLTEGKAGIPFPAGPLAVSRAELSPESLRRLALTSATEAPASPWLAGIVDHVVPAEGLLARAQDEARTLAAQPAFAAVKRQLRGDTIARLRRIVERDEEPLLEGWLPGERRQAR